MTFADAVKTCLYKYAGFSGRAGRAEFWWFTLFVFIASLGAQALEWAINSATGTPDGPRILSGVLSLALFLPGLAVTWRRLHDTGHPGWWYLILGLLGPTLSLLAMQRLLTAGGTMTVGIVPVIIGFGGLVMLLVWLVNPSAPGENEYGPNPNEVTA